MKNYTRVCARINLDAIESNVENMKNNLQENVPMIVVIRQMPMDTVLLR